MGDGAQEGSCFGKHVAVDGEVDWSKYMDEGCIWDHFPQVFENCEVGVWGAVFNVGHSERDDGHGDDGVGGCW